VGLTQHSLLTASTHHHHIIIIIIMLLYKHAESKLESGRNWQKPVCVAVVQNRLWQT